MVIQNGLANIFYSSSGGVIPFLITRFLKNLGIETTIIHSADERAINNN